MNRPRKSTLRHGNDGVKVSRSQLGRGPRAPAGGGYYVWNRHSGVEANINLYHLMHLVLADNAKINIFREGGPPIFLGLQESELGAQGWGREDRPPSLPHG